MTTPNTHSRTLLGLTIGIICLLLLGLAGFALQQRYVIIDPQQLPNMPTSQQAQFDTQVTLAINKPVTFSDGLVVTLRSINDSRCKPDVVCVWAGELSYQLTANQANVTLGTVNNKQVTQAGYTFALAGGTETSATITVTKAAAPTASCYVGGCSNEICSDQPNAVSACIYKEEFACYATATCTRQANGQCGWTQTATLQACLTSKR